LRPVYEAGPVTYRVFSVGDKTFQVPTFSYYFNNTDCWAKIEGTVAKVGVSDFIRLDPREIVSLKPPDVGLMVAIFDRLCSFTTDNVSLDVNSPVSGRVVSVNQKLTGNPGLVKEDPYERGWVVEVELSDIDDNMEFLMDCEEYFSNAKARVESGPRLGCPCSRRGRVYRSGKTQDKE
jgi:glycine cleavage system H protein